MKSKLFTAVIAIALVFSCNQKAEKKVDIKDIKTIPVDVTLDGQPNFRDLGAYTNSAGKTIKRGLLYRSGTLSNLTEADQLKLKEIGVKTVVNFLTEEERNARGEDKLPEGVRSVFLPISGENNEAAAVLEARQTGDFSEVPSDFNYKIHELLTDAGKEAYAGLFQVLSDKNNYPVVFHCSHGVHRTGTAAALVLSALEVSWEDVEKDYLLSNDFRKEEIEKRIAALDKLAAQNPTIEDRKTNHKNIVAFYQLKPAYIEGTKKAIDAKFHGFPAYFETIGIEGADLKKIQNILLEK